MALSNWDHFGITNTGEFASSVKSNLGYSIELYKNWLYVRDPQAWQEGAGYISPIVMEIREGDFNYKQHRIIAKRGPQNGIFTVILKPYADTPEIFVGCGVYGYEGDQWVGVNAESMKFLEDWINENSTMSREEAIKLLNAWQFENPTEEQIDHVMRPDYTFDEDVRTIKLSEGKRMNSGDVYFNKNLGLNTQPTKPGEAGKPMINTIIDAMKPGKGGDENKA